MKDLKKLTKRQLEAEYNAYKQLIDEIECFGKKDLVWLYRLEREIDRRGYLVNVNYKFN